MVLGLIRLIGLIGLIGGIGGRCLSGGFSERDREKFIEKQCKNLQKCECFSIFAYKLCFFVIQIDNRL